MSKTEKPTFPLRLTQAQRRAVAGLSPHLKPRLLLDQTNQRTLQFTLGEMKGIAQACRAAVPKAPTGMERNSLHHVVDAAERAVDYLEWRGPFDPEAFDAQAATKMMRRGLPNWRNQEWM